MDPSSFSTQHQNSKITNAESPPTTTTTTTTTKKSRKKRTNPLHLHPRPRSQNDRHPSSHLGPVGPPRRTRRRPLNLHPPPLLEYARNEIGYAGDGSELDASDAKYLVPGGLPLFSWRDVKGKIGVRSLLLWLLVDFSVHGLNLSFVCYFRACVFFCIE